MYSAWEAATHFRMAVRSVWRAPWCVPEAMVGWKETVDRDDGVVPSPVPVMVDESVSPWLLVWMILTGVVAGMGRLSLVWVGCGVDVLVVIARPLKCRECSALLRGRQLGCRGGIALPVGWH